MKERPAAPFLLSRNIRMFASADGQSIGNSDMHWFESLKGPAFWRRHSIHLPILAGSAFLLLAILTAGGFVDSTDQFLLTIFHAYVGEADPSAHIWSRDIMRDVTSLGGYPTLLLVSIGAFLVLLENGRRWEAFLFAVVAIGNQTSIEIVKSLVNRVRPEYGLDMALTLPRGFPSGHTAETTAIFGTVALIVTALGTSSELRILSCTVAILISFGVGISRLYLNVHWPSDVLAGWLLGGLWIALAWVLLQIRMQQATIPPPHPPTKSGALEITPCPGADLP